MILKISIWERFDHFWTNIHPWKYCPSPPPSTMFLIFLSSSWAKPICTLTTQYSLLWERLCRNLWCWVFYSSMVSFSLARPQLANPTEIPAEAKATPVFLCSTTSTSMIKDSVPKLKVDFLNNHCSDFDEIWYLKTLCEELQHNTPPRRDPQILFFWGKS